MESSDHPRVLVTGATGLIGSTLTRQLVEAGERVRIFRRPTSRLDLLGEAAQQVEHATGDLRDPISLRQAMDGIKTVYHTAAVLGAEGQHDRDTLRRVNVEGTAHVTNAALSADVGRLVHTSSIAALGGRTKNQPVRIDETAEWRPSQHASAYARSKHDAELEIHRAIAEGLDAVIVNPALVFGVGREGENTRRIVDAVREERLPGVPAGGTCVVDVEDVAEGHRRAMQRGETGARYILGNENLSWRTILHTLAAAFGTEVPDRTIPPRLARVVAGLSEALATLLRTRPFLSREAAHSMSRTRYYDNRKARDELGCSFRPFAETARRIAEALSVPS